MRALCTALLLSTASVLGWSGTTHASVPPAPTPLDILVVAGQSNALCNQSFVVDPSTHKNVFADSHSAANRSVLITWKETSVPSSGPVPVPLDTPQRLHGVTSPVFGPEVGLARTLYAAGHHHLLIVKVVFTGSSLAVDWQLGTKDFDKLVTAVHAATVWATRAGYAPTIDGFYWMQGESDAMDATWASHYRVNLLGFIANVRTALGMVPAAPFVLGEVDLRDYIDFEQAKHDCLTSTCVQERHWNAEVMAAQRSVASSDVFVASTSQLPRFDSFIHLTNGAELVLGRRFATLSEHHLA